MTNANTKTTQKLPLRISETFNVALNTHRGSAHFTAKQKGEALLVAVTVPTNTEESNSDFIAVTIEGLPLDFIQRLAPNAEAGSSTCVSAGPVTFFLKSRGE